jgi:polysaccharide biosynthesis transport protein
MNAMNTDAPIPNPSEDAPNQLPVSSKRANTALSTYLNPAQAAPKEQEDALNLREYWAVIVKHRWLVLSCLLLALMIGTLVTFLKTPIYRATTVVQIDRETLKVVDFQDMNPNESSGADFYQTQYELLKSRSLAERVVDQLGLANQQQVLQAREQGLLDWVLNLLNGDTAKNAPAAAQQDEKQLEAKRKSNAVNMLSQLTVEPIRNSRLVKVSYDSADPQMAAKVANAVVQNFINVNMERKFETTSYAKSFLEERIAQVKERLEFAERAMLEYGRDNEIVTLGGQGGGTTVSRNLEGFNAALADAKQERIKAESLYRQLQSAHSGDLPQVLDSGIIRSLRENRVRLESEYQDKLSTYRAAHPSMQELDARIKEIDTQVKKERRVVAESIRATFEAAKAHESMIMEQFVAAKGDVIKLQTAEIQYNILKRDADTHRELYDGLLQRYREVGVGGGIGANNISVVDSADIPKSPYKPDIKLNLLIALMLGLVGGVGIAFLFEHLDDTFKSASDIEDMLGLPVFGLIPHDEQMQKGSNIIDISIDSPRSAIVEAYRSVRTALQFAGENGAPQLIAITSAEKGESKTTSSVGLAIQFAQLGQRVLIIDADLRNPSVHKTFGGTNHLGLTNILSGAESPVDVTHNTAVKNLYYIASGPLPPNPAELLASNRMLELIELARNKFDYIVIDSPPILGLADVLVIANLADALILQIHAGSTRRSSVQQALKRITNVRIRPLGCMLTRIRNNSQGYGYHYDYYYSYGDQEGPATQPSQLKTDTQS